jgi:hypothetical protein
VTVVGLYLAYVIPVFLRWRMGDTFKAGPWTLGNHYKWMCPFAIVEVLVVVLIAFLPTSPLGIPGRDGFAWNNGAINYCPVIVLGVLAFAGIWWILSAHNWFTGPVRTIDDPDLAPVAGD